MTYISPTKALQHVDRLADWKLGKKPAPVTVEWDLSNRCHLGCESCHFAHTHTKGPLTRTDRSFPTAWEGTGDLADRSLVERGLKEMANAGVRGVVWSGGGEPTTHPSWEAIVEHADSLGLQQGMYTAGSLLTAESGQHLSELASWVVVSLDTLDAPTYAKYKRTVPKMFDRACDGIQFLVGRKAVVGVSFLLTGENWQQAPEMRNLGLGLGGTYVTFRPMIETKADDPATITSDRSWITDAIPMLRELSGQPGVECNPERFEQYRDWTGHGYKVCHGIKLNATITPDGRVWVCLQRRGMQRSQVGDLTKESFESLWDKHPGIWTDFTECRAMCRLHLVNQQLEQVFEAHPHASFV